MPSEFVSISDEAPGAVPFPCEAARRIAAGASARSDHGRLMQVSRRRSSGKALKARRWRSFAQRQVSADNDKRLERRVGRAAVEALADHKLVSPIDVLCGLGWLHPSNVDRWRRGAPARLEDVVFIEPSKIASAIWLLQTWASERGLEPSECPYAARAHAARASLVGGRRPRARAGVQEALAVA